MCAFLVPFVGMINEQCAAENRQYPGIEQAGHSIHLKFKRELLPQEDYYAWGFGIAWSPDSQRLAILSCSGHLLIFNLKGNVILDKHVIPCVGRIQFSPEGDKLAYISNRSKLPSLGNGGWVVYDSRTGELLARVMNLAAEYPWIHPELLPKLLRTDEQGRIVSVKELIDHNEVRASDSVLTVFPKMNFDPRLCHSDRYYVYPNGYVLCILRVPGELYQCRRLLLFRGLSGKPIWSYTFASTPMLLSAVNAIRTTGMILINPYSVLGIADGGDTGPNVSSFAWSPDGTHFALTYYYHQKKEELCIAGPLSIGQK